MNIGDISAKPNISIYKPQSGGEGKSAIYSGAENMIVLMAKSLKLLSGQTAEATPKSLKPPSGQTAEAAKSKNVDIII